MARSGFGSILCKLNAHRLGFLRLPYSVNSGIEHVADPLYKRYAVTRLSAFPLLVRVHGFRLFHPRRSFRLFPHGTGSLSVVRDEIWMVPFRQDTTCPALLIELTACAFLCTGCHPVSRAFPALINITTDSGSACSPFARRYCESRLISFPGAQMFQFPPASLTYGFS